jgi:AmiR/NasT family two-component response regulator
VQHGLRTGERLRVATAIAFSSGGIGAPALTADLSAVGMTVLADEVCTKLVQDVIRHAPDLVILYEASPEPPFFDDIAAVLAAAPRPVIVFTADPDADKISRATQVGVHAYVVNGYGQNRLRSVIHLAQARFRHEQALRDELALVNRRFAERKLLDRAKGILMGARGLREEEAYQSLRRAAMDTKRRVGQVAQQVIDSARYAEAINRAGHLRMLSQRLVKLYAAQCGGVRAEESRELFAVSIRTVDGTFAVLDQALSKATFGDLLESVLGPWRTFRRVLDQPPQTGRLREVDQLAEVFLLRSEQLTKNLEVAGFRATLHVVNVAGRQRMLSQRVAKAVLIAGLLGGKAAEDARAVRQIAEQELADGFDYLGRLPLSSDAIDQELDHASHLWQAFRQAVAEGGSAAGQDAVIALSEALLGHLETLTGLYERSVQALTG